MSTENHVRDANLAVVSNMAELVAEIVTRVAGNDIANTIEGQGITKAFVAETASLKIGALAETHNLGVQNAQ